MVTLSLLCIKFVQERLTLNYEIFHALENWTVASRRIQERTDGRIDREHCAQHWLIRWKTVASTDGPRWPSSETGRRTLNENLKNRKVFLKPCDQVGEVGPWWGPTVIVWVREATRAQVKCTGCGIRSIDRVLLLPSIHPSSPDSVIVLPSTRIDRSIYEWLCTCSCSGAFILGNCSL